MSLNSLFLVLKGGPRSGNRGHSGRPGKHGGSAPKGVPQNLDTLKYVEQHLNKKYEPKKIATALNTLTKLVEDCPVVTRVPSPILLDILKEGKFKNQHETGTSGGTLDPEYRKQAERRAFGPDLEGPSDLPIYAYIATGKNGFTPRTMSYGDAKIIFNDDVKKRTTITAGDSLTMFTEGTATGSPLLKPTTASLDDSVSNLTEYGSPYGYVEAQVHGGLTAKDINRVVLSGASPVLEKSLKEKGIPFTIASYPSEVEDL